MTFFEVLEHRSLSFRLDSIISCRSYSNYRLLNFSESGLFVIMVIYLASKKIFMLPYIGVRRKSYLTLELIPSIFFVHLIVKFRDRYVCCMTEFRNY